MCMWPNIKCLLNMHSMLIRSRSSDNHTYKHTCCVYLQIYICFLFAFLSIQDSCLPKLSVSPRYGCGWAAVGPCMHTCMCMHACLSLFFVSVKTQSYLCFTIAYERRICSLFVHFYEHARQVSVHTRAHMQRSFARPWAAVVTSVTLIRSRSSDNHTYKHTYCVYVSVCLYICVCCLFAFLSIHDSCLPNSLFLLDTANLNWETTCCRPCQPALMPGFHCLSECACFSWLCAECCAWVKVLNVCECVCINGCIWQLFDHIKWLLHMDSTSALYIQASGHMDIHVRTNFQTQWMD